MKSFFPATPEERAEIDLTSMLDVVFIMLIFFVVTATFLNEAGVSVASPSSLPDDTETVESILVVVEKGGIFKVNGRLLSADSLPAYVQALHAENVDAPYSVLVRKDAKVRDTVSAVDVGRMIGFQVVPIARATETGEP